MSNNNNVLLFCRDFLNSTNMVFIENYVLTCDKTSSGADISESQEVPRYLLGKEVHQIEPLNSAELPAVPRTETIIAYNAGSDEAMKHPDKVLVTKSQANDYEEEGSIGLKAHQSVQKNNRPGTPIPPKRIITKLGDWKKINK